MPLRITVTPISRPVAQYTLALQGRVWGLHSISTLASLGAVFSASKASSIPVVKEACSSRLTMAGSFSWARFLRYPRDSKSPNGSNVTAWLRAGSGLKLDHLSACNVFGSLQTNQQLLDLIKLNRVPRQAGNVVRQAIIRTLRVGHVERPGQGPYVLCGRRGS
jgi:hypothetical protein